MVSGNFLTVPGLKYHTFCAQMCSKYSNCYSFFYDVTDYSCFLHDDVYTTSTTSHPSTTRYYVSDSRVPSTAVTTEQQTTEAETATTTPTTTTTTTTTTTVPPPVCTTGFTSTSGYCFLISTIKRSWTSARTSCRGYGNADLLVIDSSTKQTFFNNYMKNNGHLNSYHFGVHHIYSNGNFELVDGRTQATATFTYWGTGEPNNIDGPDLCGFINWKNSVTELRWNDGACTYQDYYICEVNMS
ncbi:hypothetical protein SNE40_004805 [Patella caerulea]